MNEQPVTENSQDENNQPTEEPSLVAAVFDVDRTLVPVTTTERIFIRYLARHGIFGPMTLARHPALFGAAFARSVSVRGAAPSARLPGGAVIRQDAAHGEDLLRDRHKAAHLTGGPGGNPGAQGARRDGYLALGFARFPARTAARICAGRPSDRGAHGSGERQADGANCAITLTAT